MPSEHPWTADMFKAPNGWAPLPQDPMLPRTVFVHGQQVPLPCIPDGQGCTLNDWAHWLDHLPEEMGRTASELRRSSTVRRWPVRDNFSTEIELMKQAQTTPIPLLDMVDLLLHTAEDPGLRPSPDSLSRALLPVLQDKGSERAMAQAAQCSAGGTTARSLMDKGLQSLFVQEMAVVLLLAAGAPVNAQHVAAAFDQPNPMLTLRLLQAWPTNAPASAFLTVDAKNYPSSLLNDLLKTWRFCPSDKAVVLDALLATGHPVDLGPDTPRLQPLSVVVQNNDLQPAKRLIRAGVDVNAADRNGDTPMYWALTSSPEMLDLLLDAGADPRHTGRLHSPAVIIVKYNVEPIDLLQHLAKRDATRSDDSHGPLLTVADEQDALKILNGWARCSPGLTVDQQVAQNWLESRALQRDVESQVSPIVGTRHRL